MLPWSHSANRAGASCSVWPETFASRVHAALERLAGEQMIQRLWAKDASLWTSDPAAQQHIRQRLGWLSIDRIMEPQLDQIQAVAQSIQHDGFTHTLLLGMGGSSLFPEVCRFTLGVTPGWLDLTLLDSTDPSAITEAAQRLPLERTLVVVSSKSGTTIESHALDDYFYERIRALTGERAGRQFLAITDAGTPLETQAKQRGFRHVFVHGPTTGQDVGGRFSGLTCFGLVPAALMGIDVRRLLAGATQMLAACQASVPPAENPAATLALALSEAWSQGRDKVTLASAASLARFGGWAEQLLAESTGKIGKGLIPIDGEPIRAAGSYQADRIFVELQLASQPDAGLAQRLEALATSGHPVVRCAWHDAYDLGGEAIRWFLATSLAAGVMRIDPFDEPNVQESKDRTKALLDHYGREGALPDEPPVLTDGTIAVYGDGVAKNEHSVIEAVRAFLQQIKTGDYLAIASFLPRRRALDDAVESFRHRLADTLGVATMLGYGPRYLHSTGQLHKGGPDRVLLLFLTAEDPVDISVPGKPYTFSILKQAQALGDVQALRERRRRVLRLHLGSSPREALQKLDAAFSARPLAS